MGKDGFDEVGKNLPDHLEINFEDSESKQISDVQKQFKKAGTKKVSRSDAKAMLKKIKKGK